MSAYGRAIPPIHVHAGVPASGERVAMEMETKGMKVDLSRAVWRTSSAGGTDAENCVQVAFLDEAILLRDARDPDGPVLVFNQAEWDAFVDGAKDGEFDL
jgi:hypothetical protein